MIDLDNYIPLDEMFITTKVRKYKMVIEYTHGIPQYSYRPKVLFTYSNN